MAEISDEVLKSLEEKLNQTIRNLLYGGPGDAGWNELHGAATCFETLKVLGLKIRDEDSVRITLEHENLYNDNFIVGL